ncbi:MAG: polyprenyl synthetase family protein, partial [Caulobacteraceae bacterium]
PLLIAVARSEDREAGFWERTIARREQVKDDFRRARELVMSLGALETTLNMARDYAESAKARLLPLPAGSWRSGLEALADFAVSRRS